MNVEFEIGTNSPKSPICPRAPLFKPFSSSSQLDFSSEQITFSPAPIRKKYASAQKQSQSGQRTKKPIIEFLDDIALSKSRKKVLL